MEAKTKVLSINRLKENTPTHICVYICIYMSFDNRELAFMVSILTICIKLASQWLLLHAARKLN